MNFFSNVLQGYWARVSSLFDVLAYNNSQYASEK